MFVYIVYIQKPQRFKIFDCLKYAEQFTSTLSTDHTWFIYREKINQDNIIRTSTPSHL